MNELEHTAQQVIEHISPHLKESTLTYRKEVMNQFLQKAEQLNTTAPCQELYDAFAEDDHGSKQRRTIHLLINKLVDYEAGTHAFNPNGTLYNSLRIYASDEANEILKNAKIPIESGVDMGVLITCIESELKPLRHTKSIDGQYLHACKDIREYFFHKGHTDYSPQVLEDYLRFLNEQNKSGKIKAWRWKINQKAAFMIREISATGHVQWMHISSHILAFADVNLESIRQAFLSSLHEENLSQATIDLRDYVFRTALMYCNITTSAELYVLSAENVELSVRSFSEKCELSSLTTILNNLRIILCFLYETGYIREMLASVIIIPAHHRYNIVGYMTNDDESNFLAVLDELPLRDKAMALLALKLGIRNKDICCLKFSEIDWKKDKIRINQHKTGVPLVYPLTAAVGNAVWDYLKNERPKASSPFVFLRRQAPYLPIKKSYTIIRKAVDKAGVATVNGPHRGPHMLRDTFVNRLIQKETPYTVINDALGHTSKDSCKHYISMEESMLRQCCLELDLIGIKHWGGGRHE